MTTPREILSQFDAAYDDLRWADLGHGYYYLVDARLHAYADRDRWALVIEVVGYNPRGSNLFDVVHAYGNCLTVGQPGYENEDFLARIDNYDEVESDEPEEYVGDVPLIIRGQAIAVEAPAGEDLCDVFRRLTPSHRELLLATEHELRRRIPTDIPEILRLDEWHHPDAYDERPSSTEAFQQLALVLATADRSHYSPTQSPNTHWSNWPDSGSL